MNILSNTNVSYNFGAFNSNYCNNCNSKGHIFYQCKQPINSIGIIVFRNNEITSEREYLMIRRKDSIGYVEFMRGKYNIYSKIYFFLKNLLYCANFRDTFQAPAKSQLRLSALTKC